NQISEHNTIPYGWIDYEVILDGERLDSEAIMARSGCWKRENDIAKATVTTEFILDCAIKVRLQSFIPYGSEALFFKVAVSSYDPLVGATDRLHSVEFRFRLHLETRQGVPIYSSISYENGLYHLVADGVERYEKVFRVTSSINEEPRLLEKMICSRLYLTASKKETSGAVCFCFDGKNSVEEEKELYQSHLASWADYYGRVANVEGGDAKSQFLFNSSLYLFRMGYDPKLGIPIGHPFFFPWCWMQCTFWDSSYVCDAMLRSGNVQAVRDFLGYLKRSVRPSGKAFPWMMIYNGKTFLDEKKDIAPLVICAHAMTAIRYYECTKDEKDLQDLCYPILKRCAETAVELFFRKDDSGRYIISEPVSNDVVEHPSDEVNQTFTAVWFLVIIRKFIEFSSRLGLKIPEIYQDIVRGYYLENDGKEYLHCRGHSAEEWHCASWLPFLTYPCEGMPLLDKQLLSATYDQYHYEDLYLSKQNSTQPWTCCIEAQSMQRVGRYERAYSLLQRAEEFAYGDGYFCEINPCAQTVGFPPYISAHGAFVSAYLNMFVSFSIWKKEGEILVGLPETLRMQKLSIKRILSPGAILLEQAEYSPREWKATLRGPLSGYRISLLKPPLIEDAAVFLNGKAHPFEAKDGVLLIILPENGAYEIIVAERKG
ncbi:MAG: hypothetical protein J6038_04290, partial [Bacilli bacterium]|nr:hypothetical protein [Bacilli bacterium]